MQTEKFENPKPFIDPNLFEKQLALTKWLNRDVSTWSQGRIAAVYDTEKRKRNKIFIQEFLRDFH